MGVYLYLSVIMVRNEVKKSRLKLCWAMMKPACGLITFQDECLTESDHCGFLGTFPLEHVLDNFLFPCCSTSHVACCHSCRCETLVCNEVVCVSNRTESCRVRSETEELVSLHV